MRNIAKEHGREFEQRLRQSRPDEVGAIVARNRIVRRTLVEGRDYQARWFSRYRPATIRSKIRKGQQTRVNLSDSGEMMKLVVRKRAATQRSMKSVVEPRTSRDKRIMGYHVFGTKRMTKRNPMGLSSVDQRRVVAGMDRVVSRIRLSQKRENVSFAVQLRS